MGGVLQRNEVLCPRCLTKITLDPSHEEHCKTPSVYCPNCEDEFEGLAEAQTDFWYDFSFQDFAKEYLKIRGYTGNPDSYFPFGMYIEQFLIRGNTEKQEHWDGNEEWNQAFEIVKEYFGKDPIPQND